VSAGFGATLPEDPTNQGSECVVVAASGFKLPHFPLPDTPVSYLSPVLADHSMHSQDREIRDFAVGTAILFPVFHFYHRYTHFNNTNVPPNT
jgi:hypothetical protein